MEFKVRREEFNEYYWYVGTKEDIVDFINNFKIKSKVRIWIDGKCCVRILKTGRVNELITDEYYNVDKGKEEGRELL